MEHVLDMEDDEGSVLGEGDSGVEPPPARRPRRISATDSDDDEEPGDEPTPDDEEAQAGEEMDEEELFEWDEESMQGRFPMRVEQDAASEFSACGSSVVFGGGQPHAHFHGLGGVPGWSPLIMGEGIDPIPPTFATDMRGTWTPWTNNGPFRNGQKIRPARVLYVGFLAKWMYQPDAEYVGDVASHADEHAHARTVATCALMGLQCMGCAKGLVCSDRHAEMTHVRAGGEGDVDDEALGKLRTRLNGELKSYTYYPNEDSSDPVLREQTARQFCWGLHYCFDENEEFTGVAYYMLVFDASFSNDELVRKVMDENAALRRAGKVNSMPEHLRNSKMERQSRIQRMSMSGDDLEKHADVMYKRVCTNADYLTMLRCVGGNAGGNDGRPFYDDIASDTPPGCDVKCFVRDPEFGGRHPFGPSVSHNHKRFVGPGRIQEGHPGINASLAGMLDAKGRPLGAHESWRDPRDWYDAEGHFLPPAAVRERGSFFLCHDASVTNLFRAPLPHKMHGSVAPSECLLRIFWDLHKDASPLLRKAQQDGKTTFEQNRDTLLALFHHDQDTADPEQARVVRAVQDTQSLDNDSLERSRAEDDHIERRAYRTHTQEHGSVWTLSARQILLEVSQEQEKVFAMVHEHDRRKRRAVRDADEAAQAEGAEPFDYEEATHKRRREHAEATDAAVRFGLQRFEHTYERKKARKMIPPGWYDICHVGLHDALKEAANVGARLAGTGRIVDPEHPDAGMGTANVGQAHGMSYRARDFSTFGQLRVELMELFSKDVQIAGNDVKLMYELYMHAYEPFQDVSYFFLMCGGAGTGKSMRAKRMQQLLCNGWVRGSGSASMKAGMNGGAHPCASARERRTRLAHPAECVRRHGLPLRPARVLRRWVVAPPPHPPASRRRGSPCLLPARGRDDQRLRERGLGPARVPQVDHHGAPRPFRAKSTALTPSPVAARVQEQHVLNTRTVKMTGENGLDTHVTVVIDSLHLESHVMCTNQGPLGLRKDKEPSASRNALSDRSWAHMVPPVADSNDDHEAEFDLATRPLAVRDRVARFRVHSCLVGYVLSFIKHMPSCRPDLSYALKLCNQWYEILWTEYNIPKPSKRKRIKLRMMLELFAVESAVYEKFVLPESGVDFADMRPDANGHLAPFCIEQLADVVRSLQRCVDHEVIVTAWSHSLDHSPQTCAHVQQVMSTLATLHGNDFDRRTLVGNLPAPAAPGPGRAPPPPAPPQGRMREPSEDENDALGMAAMNQVEAAGQTVHAMMNHFNQSGAAAPAAAVAPPNAPGDDEGPMRHENGNVAMSPANFVSMMGFLGKTREQCAAYAREMEVQRQCRAEMSRRCLGKQLDGGIDAHAQLTKLFTDGRDRNNEPMHRMPATGQVISAKRAAGACMPHAADLIDRGMPPEALVNFVAGEDVKVDGLSVCERQIGTKCDGWEYKALSEAEDKGPADWDYNWARMTAFGAPGADARGGGLNKKTIWSNSAKLIFNKGNGCNNPRVFFMNCMTEQCVRDTLYMAASPDNHRRIPWTHHARRLELASASRMLSQNQIFTEACPPAQIHPHCMYTVDPATMQRVLDPSFMHAPGFERPVGSTVAVSDYHKRLDHLAQHRALPVAIPPERYKIGSVIEECEAFNGIYFNKQIASEQANMVVEIAHFLSTVPGITGGEYMDGPEAFKSTGIRSNNVAEAAAQGVAETMEELSREEQSERVANQTGGPGADGEPPGLPPEDALPVDEAHMRDFGPVDLSVRNPAGPDAGVGPKPGASDDVSEQSHKPDALQATLPYTWDQFAIFGTCKMIDTLHNDCEDYVDGMREALPDVFGNEPRHETLARLPQICTRFPGTRPHGKKLYPISRSVPLKASRVHEISKKARPDSNDNDDDDACAARDTKGNLFARSTWVQFTLNALQDRGMLTDDEIGRVNDQGLCLRWYARNHRASRDDDNTAPPPNQALRKRKRATTETWQARDNKKPNKVAARPVQTREDRANAAIVRKMANTIGCI